MACALSGSTAHTTPSCPLFFHFSGFLGSGASQTGIPDALYSADTELRVYAPAGENGAGLSGVISEMLRALELFDERRIVTKREVGSIEFDSDLGAIFRRLRFRVEFCLCEEG